MQSTIASVASYTAPPAPIVTPSNRFGFWAEPKDIWVNVPDNENRSFIDGCAQIILNVEDDRGRCKEGGGCCATAGRSPFRKLQ